MPWTKLKARGGRRLYKPRRRYVGRRRFLPLMALRPRYNATPTFTETFKMTTLNGSSTGVTAGLLQTCLNYVPQVTDYTALYNQYCIRSVQFILIPSYDSYDSTNGTALPAGITAPRLVYAINDSAQQPTPTTELDVLTDNGAKIRMLDRPVRIRCRPVAQVGMSASTGGFVSESKRNRWLSTANPEILHTGVSFAISQTIPSTLADPNIPIATLYAKVTFSLRDPK